MPLLLAGCGAGGAGGTSSSADSAAVAAAPQGEAATGGAAAGGAPDPAAATTRDSLAQGRVVPEAVVVRTGDLSVRVDDVAAAADAAGRLVTGAGGQVTGDQRSTRTGSVASADLVLRLTPATFDATVDKLAALGTELDRNLSSTDVTDEVVDLDSRLATQRAGVDRVRTLLSGAKTLGEVVQVEAELTRRTADLESLEARLQALQGKASLGTVTLHLLAADTTTLPVASDRLSFLDGLSGGWHTVVDLARLGSVAVGALLPFVPFALVLLAVTLWLRRRRQVLPVPAPPATT